jgi:hypothetical protein
MAELKVYHDVTGRMLTVWFGHPEAKHVCEETGDEIILIKIVPTASLVSKSSTIQASAPSQSR